jgi:hypothetical protein
LRILNNDRLCSQVTNAEESNELQVPCDCVVGDFRNILEGGLFKDKGNHENTTGQEQKRFWHQLLTFTNSPGIGATPDAKPRCESVVSRSFRSLSSSRVPETCLQIQRGGANRFVNEDGNKFGNKSNNDEIIGSNAYDSNRNRMRLDETKSASKGLRKHSPVVYQYFGRSRSRGGQSHPSQADDAPLNFILLGPNVDHWKTVGQTLASRGFNVMACERMVERQQRKSGGTDGGGNEAHEGSRNYEDAPELVLEILGACSAAQLLSVRIQHCLKSTIVIFCFMKFTAVSLRVRYSALTLPDCITPTTRVTDCRCPEMGQSCVSRL